MRCAMCANYCETYKQNISAICAKYCETHIKNVRNVQLCCVQAAGSNGNRCFRKCKVGNRSKVCLWIRGYTCRTDIQETSRSTNIQLYFSNVN